MRFRPLAAMFALCAALVFLFCPRIAEAGQEAAKGSMKEGAFSPEKKAGSSMVKPVRIDEKTWRIEDGGVRFFLLCGTEKALLLDTGMNAPDAKKIAQSLTDLPIILMNTHADRDHISGNAAFEEAMMSPAEADNYRANGGSGKIVPVMGGDIIDLGGRKLLIIDNPGHTPGSIAVLDGENRVLYSGDAVQDGNIYLFGKFRNVPLYAESLARLSELTERFDAVYPCHGNFPVAPSLISRLLEGIDEVMTGRAKGNPVDLHGRKVMLYRFPYAGFYCEMPAE